PGDDPLAERVDGHHRLQPPSPLGKATPAELCRPFSRTCTGTFFALKTGSCMVSIGAGRWSSPNAYRARRSCHLWRSYLHGGRGKFGDHAELHMPPSMWSARSSQVTAEPSRSHERNRLFPVDTTQHDRQRRSSACFGPSSRLDANPAPWEGNVPQFEAEEPFVTLRVWPKSCR